MASDYVKNIEQAATRLADAVKATMTLEDNRHAVKMAAINRIMKSGDNPLTNKPHSFSSAEALVHSDAQYADYLEQIREAEYSRILARGAYDAALAAARLQSEVA
ncbi:hypothetical protein EBZ80_13845 [bacterium]|nr:hypothetical protein [Betaproteobacteria bacterium]NDE16005.1 hypothetical protein [bacterium]